jgi:acyl-CoA carboxylase subunit alpha
MKMEHRVLATNAGTVTELLVEKTQQVNAGDVLAVVEES